MRNFKAVVFVSVLFLSLPLLAQEETLSEIIGEGEEILPRCSYKCVSNGSNCSITCKVGQGAFCFNYHVNFPELPCQAHCACGKN